MVICRCDRCFNKPSGACYCLHCRCLREVAERKLKQSDRTTSLHAAAPTTRSVTSALSATADPNADTELDTDDAVVVSRPVARRAKQQQSSDTVVAGAGGPDASGGSSASVPISSSSDPAVSKASCPMATVTAGSQAVDALVTALGVLTARASSKGAVPSAATEPRVPRSVKKRPASSPPSSDMDEDDAPDGDEDIESIVKALPAGPLKSISLYLSGGLDALNSRLDLIEDTLLSAGLLQPADSHGDPAGGPSDM